MTDLLLVEKVALAIVNVEQKKHDFPELASLDDLRLTADRDLYTLLATAAIAAMPGYEAGLVEGFKQGIDAAAKVAQSVGVAYEGQRECATGVAEFHYGGCASGARKCVTAIRALSPPSIADDGKEGAG